MKICIFSDSHGDSGTMCGVVEKERPDMIIYLGDGIEDAEELSRRYPDIEIVKNLGNVDSRKEDEEWIKYAEICGKRFMMTHGHTFIDKAEGLFKGQQDMFMYANNVDIVLYGHCHEPFINCCGNKWIMSPGRIGRSRNIQKANLKPTYGVLEISGSGALTWQFSEVE